MLQINPPIKKLVADAHSRLEDYFGVKASTTAVAPGRVNLIGEHIDYCDGFVLPFALDRAIVIAGRARLDHRVRIATDLNHEVVSMHLDAPLREADPKWSNYIRGVMRGFQKLGHHLPGFDAFIVSSIPRGAGLSSSAALELAVATLLEGMLDTRLKTREKALLCQKAEHDFAHVPCGIMDQFASAFGRENQLILIDCRSEEPDLVPFSNPDLTMLVANTMVQHELSDGGYAARRQHTEDGLKIIGKNSWREVSMKEVEDHWNALSDPVNRRARHVVGEIERTKASAEALSRNDFEALGPLMAASHDSLRHDFEVSCDELDTMVKIARGIGREGGVIGSRMTGGGFGGSTVTLCESSKAADIAETLAAEYNEATGIRPQIFSSRPCDGARLVK